MVQAEVRRLLDITPVVFLDLSDHHSIKAALEQLQVGSRARFTGSFYNESPSAGLQPLARSDHELLGDCPSRLQGDTLSQVPDGFGRCFLVDRSDRGPCDRWLWTPGVLIGCVPDFGGGLLDVSSMLVKQLLPDLQTFFGCVSSVTHQILFEAYVSMMCFGTSRAVHIPLNFETEC